LSRDNIRPDPDEQPYYDQFQEWGPYIMQVLSAWNNTGDCWNHLPFSGGVFDQEKVNGYTWAVWQYIIQIWKSKSEKRKS